MVFFQTLHWQKTIYADAQQAIYDMKSDNKGNLVVVGTFQGRVSFAGTKLDFGSGDRYFIAKFDTSGKLLWMNTANGNSGNNFGHLEISDKGDYFFSGEYLPNNVTFPGYPVSQL